MSTAQHGPTAAEAPCQNGAHSHDGLIDLPTLWRRKWTILAMAALACGFGFAFSKLSTPLFESEAKLMVQVDEQLLATRRLDQKVFMENQAQLIQSPVVLSEATRLLSAELSAEELEYLSSEVRASPIASTNVLVVGVRGRDAQSPVDMLQAVIQEYCLLLAKEDQKAAEQSLQLIRLESESLEQEMAAANRELAQLGGVEEENSVVIDSVEFQVATLKDLEAEIKQVRLQRREFEQLLAQVAGTERIADRDARPRSGNDHFARRQAVATVPVKFTATPLDSTTATELLALVAAETGNHEIAKMRQELRDAQSTFNGMLHHKGAGHPDRIAAESRIAVLEDSLNETLEFAVGQVRHRLQSLADREAELQMQRTETVRAVRSANEGQLLAKRHFDRLTSLDEMRLDLLKQRHALEQQVATSESVSPSVHVRVLDEPELSADSLWPRIVTLLATCGCFGLFAGCVFVTLQTSAAQHWPHRES